MSTTTIQRIPSPLGLPFSAAVRVGDSWELSGQIGLTPGTTTVVPGGVGPETIQTMKNIAGVLETIGATWDDVVKVGVFMRDIGEFDAMNEVYKTFFTPGTYPARSAVGVAGLALGASVEIECVVAAN